MSGQVALCTAGVLTGCAVWLLADGRVLLWLRAGIRRLRALRTVRLSGSARDRAASLPPGVSRVLGVLRGRAGRYRERGVRASEQARCIDELPELIDVVALGLSAGVSFDAALGIYCERYRTGLAAQLGEAMQSWRLGVATRRGALHALAERLQVGAFTTFCETVTESLDFGAPLAKTLVGQAEAVRRTRRSAVEEQIEKAPVKMLVPTGTLVLPAMLLAILGPLLAALSATSL